MAARHAVKRVKKAVTLERSLFREICELKIFCVNTKPISVIKVLYKRLMEPENGGHTHTQSEYCNARAHARRALIIIIRNEDSIQYILVPVSMP